MGLKRSGNGAPSRRSQVGAGSGPARRGSWDGLETPAPCLRVHVHAQMLQSCLLATLGV